MSAQPTPHLSPEEYLALDRAAEFKSEYYDGHMYSMEGMAGGSFNHGAIIANLNGVFWPALREKSLRLVSSDVRIRIAHQAYTYPDLSIVCGTPRFADNQKDTLLNPTILIEVLSPSTELVDREFKSRHYRAIESLQEYALVSQIKPHIEVFRQQTNGEWALSEPHGLDASCRFESIGCEVPLSEIYYKISFEPET